MNTNNPPSSYAETIFSQRDYEGGRQDDADTGDWESVTTNSDMQEAFPRYVPPHKRPINLEMGDHTQVQIGDKADEQGVQNRSFQKLMVYVSFALVKSMVEKLSKAFPGCFFVSRSHNNHDHPYSHVVTQVGTRFLQRMIQPGQWVLDWYGNPNSVDRFNGSQRPARTPKVMYALVAKACSADFIREVNKWGPPTDAEGDRYRTGHSKRNLDWMQMFDVFQLIHTLYYVTCADLCEALHLPVNETRPNHSPRRKALALIHTHTKTHGFLNEGEQEYWVRGNIVKQRNVSTNTTYCHPNITPFWFAENKQWYGDDGKGFTWECHFVCQDTWIIEIVPCNKDEFDDDFVNTWEDEFELGVFDTPAERKASVKPVTVLPTKNGRFIELDVCCEPLFTDLRRYAIGKPRAGLEGVQLMKDLITRGRNLVNPSSLFPDKPAMDCPDGAIYDHCLSAFVTDLERETNMMTCLDNLQGEIYKHSYRITGKRPPPSLASNDIVGTLKLLAKVGTHGARLARSKNPVDAALSGLDKFLE
jgi:hypothetical protein